MMCDDVLPWRFQQSADPVFLKTTLSFLRYSFPTWKKKINKNSAEKQSNNKRRVAYCHADYLKICGSHHFCWITWVRYRGMLQNLNMCSWKISETEMRNKTKITCWNGRYNELMTNAKNHATNTDTVTAVARNWSFQKFEYDWCSFWTALKYLWELTEWKKWIDCVNSNEM